MNILYKADESCIYNEINKIENRIYREFDVIYVYKRFTDSICLLSTFFQTYIHRLLLKVVNISTRT